MEANDYAFVHGMRRTRLALASWSEDPAPVVGAWLAAAAAIGLLLLAGVWVVASVVEPDAGFHLLPRRPDGLELGAVGSLMARNSIVLALHACACVAGFIAGSTLPLTSEGKSGLSRWVHEKARPVAFGWVIFVTGFSLITQAIGLGLLASTLAFEAGISPGLLLLTALPHALLELTAVFLPLAAWTIASRRGQWDQLFAATMVTVAMAIPMLLVSASLEVYVWPHILDAASPIV